MPFVQTKTTYLETRVAPGDELPPPPADVCVERVTRPTCEFYRHLYRTVGESYRWVDRLVMPQEQLESILQDEQVKVYVLQVAGEAGGYSELDCRGPENEIEIAYFGLFPSFVGRGLGSWFLNWTLHAAWSRRPDRVWVHTCDLDHPAALPTYLKAGFKVYQQRTIDQFLPQEQA
jgi:GNAT superfamily N-acetyltransferase